MLKEKIELSWLQRVGEYVTTLQGLKIGLVLLALAISLFNLVPPALAQGGDAFFVEVQAIPTNGARDWEFFTIGSNHYLVVANGHTDSKIYKWDGSSFAETQVISTSSATDWEFLGWLPYM